MTDYEPPEALLRNVVNFGAFLVAGDGRTGVEQLDSGEADKLWQLLCTAAVNAIHHRDSAPAPKAATRQHMTLIAADGVLTTAGEAILAQRAAERERRRQKRKAVAP